jgi:hypothetical protein
MHISDLTSQYGTKTDEELLRLVADLEQLVPEARTVLAAELGKRCLSPGKDLSSEKKRDNSVEPQANPPISESGSAYKVGEFVDEVLRLYRSQFWYFVKLVAPAVVTGYLAVRLSRREVAEIARQVPAGRAAIEMMVIALAGYLFSWMAFSVSFGAICSAVYPMEAGTAPSVPLAFASVHRRIGPFLCLSLLLFVLCLIANGTASLLWMGIFWLSFNRHLHLDPVAMRVFSLGFVYLTLILLSRFALSVPAVVLDGYPVGKAMFRSDELTEGKWSILAVLVAKSVIGGYLAGMSPFWIASWILRGGVTVPLWFPWLLTAASIAAVTVVEPTMFIGFALLYLKTSVASTRSPDIPAVQLA